MGLYYAGSTHGFYDEDVHGTRKLPGTDVDNPDCKIPIDAVPVTAQQRQTLLIAQSQGKLIQPDANGAPVAVDQPTESTAGALERALRDIRTARIPILDALAGIAGRAQRAGDTATASAADTASVALLNITQLPALLNATTYDAMETAVLQQYRIIAATAPPSVQSAFLEVLS